MTKNGLLVSAVQLSGVNKKEGAWSNQTNVKSALKTTAGTEIRVIFDRTYYTPVNFTMTGKTNGSMDVDTIRDPDLLTGVSSLLKKRDTGDVPMLLSPEEDDDHTEKIVPIIS